MNVWNALLQSLHSALIDEINVQFKKDKLELGLPKRHEGWFSPEHLEALHFSRVHFKSGETGVVCLSIPPSIDKDFWTKTLSRAEVEFKRRSVEPLLGDLTPSLPAQTTRMVLWMPVKLVSRSLYFDLGIGVY